MISLFLDTCSAKLIVGVYNGIDPIVLNIEIEMITLYRKNFTTYRQYLKTKQIKKYQI